MTHVTIMTLRCIVTETQTDRQTDRQTDKQTDRQTDRQTDGHMLFLYKNI